MVSAFAADASTKRRGALLVLTAGLIASGPACSSSDSKPGGGSDASAVRDGSGVDGTVPNGPDSSPGGSGVTVAPDGSPFEKLSQWHLFADGKKQVPSDRVVPYDVIAQLFSDYAFKRRFIYVPPGKTIGYSATEKWAFPVGTVLVKTFSYLADARDPTKGETLLETRLLIHEADGWVPHTYVWNAAQTDATIDTSGTTIDSQFIDPSGKDTKNAYAVPSANDCRNCHGVLGVTDTLGGRTRQLDRDHDYGSGLENQIDHLAKLGFFDRKPDAPGSRVHLVDPFGSGTELERVRSYFDSNCSHCHQPGKSPGSPSGLWLDYASTDPAEPRATWGVCKQPASAGGSTCGHQFDIVPGAPDDSILICRLESTLAKVRMPPVGRNLVHAEGVKLLRDWISALPGSCGAPPPPPPDAGHREGGVPDASTPDAAPTDAGPG